MTPAGDGAPVVAARWRPFRLPMRHRFETAYGALDDREGVLLELRDEAGLTGVGEASPLAMLGGGDRDDVLRLLERHASALVGIADGAVPSALPADEPGAAALRCAVDVALLDLAGRRRGVPLAALLSETPADSVLVNAILGSGEPAAVAAHGREAVEAGYGVLKLKVGVGSVEHDVECVAALREACPDAAIRVDANGAWDERSAADAMERLAPLRVELLEQPVPAGEVEALARLRETAPFRVAADESIAGEQAAREVLEQRAADLLVLKPMPLGGVRPALELARRAAERGIGSFATTTFDSSVGAAAALHLAAALPWDAAQGLGTGDHLAADIVSPPLRPAGGRLAVPAPGLGVSVDPAALDRLATDDWSHAGA